MADDLRRRIGLGLLTFYGVGVMVGAGIYVLVGAVAQSAGIYAPVAFLLAGLVAAPTAFSYGELSARIPEASGEAAYVEQGLKSRWLAVLVGLAIVITGTFSAAAVLRGGVGYLTGILDVDTSIAILILGGGLTLVALVGVLESLALAALFTLIEVLGLGAVIWAGMEAAPVFDIENLPPTHLGGIGAAAALAFFAFIGFEDIVNMAEEAVEPTKTLPRAILLSLLITTFLYALVSFAAVRAVPFAELAASDRPLVLVWQAGSAFSPTFLSAIAVVAALNGVLAQIVMASRVLFGLGRRVSWLHVFNHAHPRFGTPVLATLVLGAGLLVAALSLPVAELAEMTSTVLLSVFVIINLSLIVLKRREPAAPFRTWTLVPWLGLFGALAALVLLYAGGS